MRKHALPRIHSLSLIKRDLGKNVENHKSLRNSKFNITKPLPFPRQKNFETIETVITEGNEFKDDVALPVFKTKYHGNKDASTLNTNINSEASGSNLESQVENITTNSNTMSIVEFDAKFCSDIRISMLQDSSKNIFKKTKGGFGDSFCNQLQSKSERKQLINAYKSIERLTNHGEELRKKLNQSQHCQSHNYSTCSFSITKKTPQNVPLFAKKSMTLNRPSTRRVSVQEYYSLIQPESTQSSRTKKFPFSCSKLLL